MSVFSALNVGVSGLQGQTSAISVISDNIANSTTVGYKEGVTAFESLLYGLLPSGYGPGGVSASDVQLNDLQGTIAPTESPTDIAIAGEGFFAVSPTAMSSADSLAYTRAGSFVPDKNGDFANTAGYYLQAWPLDPYGKLDPSLTGTSVNAATAIAALQTVNVKNLTPTPVPTTIASIEANLDSSAPAYSGTTYEMQATLDSAQPVYAGIPPYDAASGSANMASGAITPQFTSPVTYVDSLGTSHTLQVGYLETAANTWAVEVYATPASDVVGNSQIAAGNLTFNADGTLASVTGNLASTATVQWQDGAANSPITFNWGTAGPIPTGQANGVSQTAGASTFIAATEKGYDPTDPDTDMSSGAVTPQFSVPIEVVDNLGTKHDLNVGFLKTGVNSWAVEIYANPPSDTTAAGNQIAAGTMTFNGDGTLNSLSPSLSSPISVTWTAPNTVPSSIVVSWGTAGPILGTPGATVIGRADGMAQLDSPFNLVGIQQNGVPAGTPATTSISADGIISAIYADGTQRALYQIPLALFQEPDQLQTLGSNVFAPTVASGSYDFLQPDQGVVGSIAPEALESSNVDVATQLTNLIVAQNAYQANTKLITTSDQMLQTLDQMLS